MFPDWMREEFNIPDWQARIFSSWAYGRQSEYKAQREERTFVSLVLVDDVVITKEALHILEWSELEKLKRAMNDYDNLEVENDVETGDIRVRSLVPCITTLEA